VLHRGPVLLFDLATRSVRGLPAAHDPGDLAPSFTGAFQHGTRYFLHGSDATKAWVLVLDGTTGAPIVTYRHALHAHGGAGVAPALPTVSGDRLWLVGAGAGIDRGGWATVSLEAPLEVRGPMFVEVATPGLPGSPLPDA
jgi:hypothetical protein